MRNRNDLARDEEGLEFPDVEEAYLEAFRAARDIWQELLQEGEDPRHCAFEIADSAGRTLIELPFAEILGATSGPRSLRSHLNALAAAAERAERIRDLTSAVTREVNRARQTLEESRSLLMRAEFYSR